jgi:hypothetical protein
MIFMLKILANIFDILKNLVIKLRKFRKKNLEMESGMSIIP